MKTLNQVRDELFPCNLVNANHLDSIDRIKNHNRAEGFDACLDHLSKNAGGKEYWLDTTDVYDHINTDNQYYIADREGHYHVIDYAAYLSKCAQLAKTQDMARMAIEGVYQTMVNNNLIGEEFAKKHIDHLMGAILEIGAGK